jgi:hypothetical protein
MGGPISTRFVHNTDAGGLSARQVEAGRVSPVFVQVGTHAHPQTHVESRFPQGALSTGDPVSVTAEQLPKKKLVDHRDLSTGVGSVKVFNPALSVLLSQVTPAVEGSQRTDLTAPVSNTDDVSDEQLFEAPADASKKYYLPRFRIVENATTQGNQFAIRLQKTNTGGTLDIKLEKYPAPAIETAAAGAEAMAAKVSVLLQFSVAMQGGGSMVKELPFTEYTDDANGLHAVMPITGLTQVNQVYLAMTETSYNARLVVRRLFDIALPVTQPAATPSGQQDPHFIKWIPILRFPMIERTANGLARSAAASVHTSVVSDSAPPSGLYRQTTRTLDNNIAFTFPVALNGYIYDGITPAGNAADPGLAKCRFGEGTYYEDLAAPGLFYYLPDSFKLTRRPAPSFAPFMCVSINGDGSLDNTTVTLEYVAVPYISPNTINTAQAGAEASGLDKDKIQFQPLAAPAAFSLALPDAGGLAGPLQDRSAAMVSLRDGVHDSVSLSLKNFQLLYDALMGASLTLFKGQIIASVSSSDKIPPVSFSARLDDLAGDCCSIKQQYDAAAGKGTIVIRNETESPLTINTIRITLSDGDTPVPFTTQGAATDTLVSLPAKKELEITIVPQDTTIAAKALNLDTQLVSVQTQPDREAIWNAILNPYTPVEYERTISVETFDEMFTPPPQASSDAVVKAIVVNFFNGDSVTLKPGALKSDAKINVSLSNYILGKVDTRDYKYQVDVITLAGKRKIGGVDQWKTDQSDDLFITKDLIT